MMRKRLQLALMLTATTAVATSFSFLMVPRASAAVAVDDGGDTPQVITPTDEHGHKVYVNDPAPAKARPVEAPQPKRSKLVYWSSKENRWKPVPSAGTATIPSSRRMRRFWRPILADITLRRKKLTRRSPWLLPGIMWILTWCAQ